MPGVSVASFYEEYTFCHRAPDLAFVDDFDGFFLKIIVSVCQIVVPFKSSQDKHHILLFAKGRDDLFTLCEAELKQSSSSKTIFS